MVPNVMDVNHVRVRNRCRRTSLALKSSDEPGIDGILGSKNFDGNPSSQAFITSSIGNGGCAGADLILKEIATTQKDMSIPGRNAP
jgi:hypothetical protein